MSGLAVTGLIMIGCTSSSEGDEAETPTTLDASPLVVTPGDASDALATSTTMPSVTPPPVPLDAAEVAAVTEAVSAYHSAVAASFDPIDPESAALAAATTPRYFEKLSGLLTSLLESGRTATSDYRAEIVAISAVGENAARADLCELDRTVILGSTGSPTNDASTSVTKASYLMLLKGDGGAWRVDGGGLDGDRTCD